MKVLGRTYWSRSLKCVYCDHWGFYVGENHGAVVIQCMNCTHSAEIPDLETPTVAWVETTK